jgi:hypothetical protein
MKTGQRLVLIDRRLAQFMDLTDTIFLLTLGRVGSLANA